VLASEDARSEFTGQRLMTDEEAGAAGARAAGVVVGDSPEHVSYDTLNRAFRLVMDGAQLIGMHRNRWWVTPDGLRLDSGAIVAGLRSEERRVGKGGGRRGWVGRAGGTEARL